MINEEVLEEYLSQPYSRLLVPEKEGGYSAEILEFPGCFSQGETAEEAVKNLEDAARNWIAAALEQGLKIPEPTGDHDYSGKIALRLPRSTHRKAIQMAEREGVSLNTFLVDAISARTGAEDLYTRLEERLNALSRQRSTVGAYATNDVISAALDLLLKTSVPTEGSLVVGTSDLSKTFIYHEVEQRRKHGRS
jgi:predicted RNase H-like HicB family nuclease